jgi:hypothetical protein
VHLISRLYSPIFSLLSLAPSLFPLPPHRSVIITASSSINGVIVGAAIARGAQALIRHLIVRKKGLSIDKYDALVCFQDRVVHWRRSWTFLSTLFIFLTALLLDSATMAAFGQSLDKEKIS